MTYSVLHIYQKGEKVGEHIHFNTPQVYSWDLSDPEHPIRIYVSGAFHNGRFSESEVQKIYDELKPKYPKLKIEVLQDSYLKFI